MTECASEAGASLEGVSAGVDPGFFLGGWGASLRNGFKFVAFIFFYYYYYFLGGQSNTYFRKSQVFSGGGGVGVLSQSLILSYFLVMLFCQWNNMHLRCYYNASVNSCSAHPPRPTTGH